MTYNVRLVRISNSRGWGESYYELREIGRGKKRKETKKSKHQRKRGWIILG